MHELLNLVELGGLHRSVDRKRQRHGRVVEFLGADIDRTGAFADLDPILAERVVGQNVDVSGLHSVR